METTYLQAAMLQVKLIDQVLKTILIVLDELASLLLRQYFLDVLIWTFKVGEQQDENFLFIARYFN